MANRSLKVSLFPDYDLEDTLDNDIPDVDNGINDNNDDENYNHDDNGNNHGIHHNDNNDDDNNDKNYDKDNSGQTIMILQAMDFGEPFSDEKTHLIIYMRTNPSMSS